MFAREVGHCWTALRAIRTTWHASLLCSVTVSDTPVLSCPPHRARTTSQPPTEAPVLLATTTCYPSTATSTSSSAATASTVSAVGYKYVRGNHLGSHAVRNTRNCLFQGGSPGLVGKLTHGIRTHIVKSHMIPHCWDGCGRDQQ